MRFGTRVKLSAMISLPFAALVCSSALVGEINGRKRKLVLTAARNGYYFTIDRVTGEHVVTSKFSNSANWAKGVNAKGQPVREPAKDHHIAGALVSAANEGAANWPPPSFSPDTGLLYVPTAETYAMYYFSEIDPRGAMGLGGKTSVQSARSEAI